MQGLESEDEKFQFDVENGEPLGPCMVGERVDVVISGKEINVSDHVLDE